MTQLDSNKTIDRSRVAGCENHSLSERFRLLDGYDCRQGEKDRNLGVGRRYDPIILAFTFDGFNPNRISWAGYIAGFI